MKLLLVAVLAMAPLTGFAAEPQRGDSCHEIRYDRVVESDHGNLLTCEFGKLEFVQVIQNQQAYRELVKINQAQIQILAEAMKNQKQAAAVTAKSEATTTPASSR